MSYEGMSSLASTFQGKPFTIFAFPCNQFASQEPKSNRDIESFIRGKNGKHSCGLVYCDWTGEFPYPILAKTNVKPSWCTDTECTASTSNCCQKNDVVWRWFYQLYNASVPKWNFAGKHLIDQCGKPVKYINDETYDPAKLQPDIQALLDNPPRC